MYIETERYRDMQLTERETKGQQIAQVQDAILRVDENTYRVKSQSNNKDYRVDATEIGWKCSCPDHVHRGVKCKHIHAVELSLAIRKEVEVTRIEPILDIKNCIFCKSTKIVKDGIRHNKCGDIQKFNCKDCNKYFTINIGFEKMKHNPQGITTAMQLYFSGESLRNTQKSLRLLGVQVSHQTVYNWITKYVSLIQEYTEKLMPRVGDMWRTDELFLKVKGNTKYLFALMDDETRYWIAQQVAESKYTSDISPMFRKGEKVIGRRPSTIISDGAPNFHNAYNKVYWTYKTPQTKHIRHIRLQGDHNNNKMERINGEVRDREKVMRGLKRQDTKILTGYQIFHNYIRQHQGISNNTPAEKCGIKIEGKNKWVTLIQNAAKRS